LTIPQFSIKFLTVNPFVLYFPLIFGKMWFGTRPPWGHKFKKTANTGCTVFSDRDPGEFTYIVTHGSPWGILVAKKLEARGLRWKSNGLWIVVD
jgi:hypothetical protein